MAGEERVARREEVGAATITSSASRSSALACRCLREWVGVVREGRVEEREGRRVAVARRTASRSVLY